MIDGSDPEDGAVRTALRRSWLRAVPRAVRSLYRLGTRASETSVSVGAIENTTDRAAAVTARSAFVQWFTTEPEPATVVVDLERTRTVGPIIRFFEPGYRALVRASRTSTLCTSVRRGAKATHPLHAVVADSRVWALAKRLLTPPDDDR
ncbi:hypothetical protein [Haloarcula marina]|uniref:hypothetical protein n=1 Tax=Haloarcula marina TaxID=2961574 RepID=UPI0020B876CA|nr:hypothetical protein [Halomicroarcula marina]